MKSLSLHFAIPVESGLRLDGFAGKPFGGLAMPDRTSLPLFLRLMQVRACRISSSRSTSGDLGGRAEISQPVRDRCRDQPRGNRIRVSIVWNTMARIERDQHVGQASVIENPLSKLALPRLLGDELRNDDQRHSAAG